MSQRIDRYVEKVQEDIVSCPNEQPLVDGGLYWINDASTELESLLTDHNVPEPLWDAVVSQLRCPKCGSSLEVRQEVGTKPDHEKQIDAALYRHGEKLHEFTNFLRATPYLGSSHPTGKRIVNEIGRFPKSSLSKQHWYRARRVESPVPLTIDDLRPPSPRKHTIPEGRFNHFGQVFWYLSNDTKVAASEATSSLERLAWVQEWKIEQIYDLLDLRAWRADDDRALDGDGESIEFPLLSVALIFGDHLNAKPPDRNCSWKPEYFVPRFVSDAARRAGFSGMLFQSTRSKGENLLLFDAQAPLVPIGTPQLIHLTEAEAEEREGLFLYQGFPISFCNMNLPDIGIP